MKWEVHIKHSYCLNCHLKEKHFGYWILNQISHFFMEHHFYLNGWLADKWQLFRFKHLANISLTINNGSLSLQGKLLMVFVANDKIWAFVWKLGFWKNCIATVSFTASKFFLLLFFVFIFKNVFYWLCYYSFPNFPRLSPLHSAP